MMPMGLIFATETYMHIIKIEISPDNTLKNTLSVTSPYKQTARYKSGLMHCPYQTLINTLPLSSPDRHTARNKPVKQNYRYKPL